MKRYRTFVVGGLHPNASVSNGEKFIEEALWAIQDRLGDGWVLLSTSDGPRPWSIITVWVTV